MSGRCPHCGAVRPGAPVVGSGVQRAPRVVGNWLTGPILGWLFGFGLLLAALAIAGIELMAIAGIAVLLLVALAAVAALTG